MSILQVLSSFYILMKPATIMLVFLLMLQNNMPAIEGKSLLGKAMLKYFPYTGQDNELSSKRRELLINHYFAFFYLFFSKTLPHDHSFPHLLSAPFAPRFPPSISRAGLSGSLTKHGTASDSHIRHTPSYQRWMRHPSNRTMVPQAGKSQR